MSRSPFSGSGRAQGLEWTGAIEFWVISPGRLVLTARNPHVDEITLFL
jgi:hypothetical protein